MAAENAVIETGSVQPGYRGIWFELGQKSEYGDKYSGGLGTYTANHVPMAIYAPEVNRTFFTYGGTRSPEERHLLILVGFYDHATRTLSQPVVVMDKEGVDDPHDDASLAIDAEGYVWVFVSGRNWARLGTRYRSLKPFDISGFEKVSTGVFTYPQPICAVGQGFFHLFTKYTGTVGVGRQLYWQTSPDGSAWSEDFELSLMEGHYQVSSSWVAPDGTIKIGTFFNVHPDGDNDRRTNVYYLQTTDWGRTWTTADGRPVEVPLRDPANDALVIDYRSQGELMYTDDLNWDAAGNPLLLYVTGRHHQPGPGGDPRSLVLARWDGSSWQTSRIAAVDHNYDTGSLWVDGGVWRVLAPTGIGPQPWQGGGELELWESRDHGESWVKAREVTSNSPRNHNYARRPLNAHPGFYAFWADGNPLEFGESHLWFYDFERGEAVEMGY